jgi:hypothetical protein
LIENNYNSAIKEKISIYSNTWSYVKF